MAIKYQREEQILTLILRSNTDQVAPRLSELRMSLYGGRGGHYDETQFNRSLSDEPHGINEKLSDSSFSGLNNYDSSTNRADQYRRVWFETDRFD